MTTYQDRIREVVRRTAQTAWEQPLLDSGLWTHGDIRNNYYDASYLFAAAADPELTVLFDKAEGIKKAEGVLLRILALQDRDQDSVTYGHWPLGLQPTPQEARKNPLPAELMGSLMVIFCDRFAPLMGDELKREFELTIETLYHSTYYLPAQQTFGHHEAKYTAAKLLFGYRFKDLELQEAGKRDAQLTLERIRTIGMAEYGALPWFWHWVQAFTCAYECIPVAEIRSLLSELLDELWSYRAENYLKGSWAGARMRSLSQDLPKDSSVAFDYVQFGDFKLPEKLPRVEYAGLLFYEAPEQVRIAAMRIDEPVETKRVIVTGAGDAQRHSYLYRTEHFAAGGMWERVKEFDNEQHRWEITLPLAGAKGVNRLYILPPGEGYSEGDPRHASDSGEVLFFCNTIMALYPFHESGDKRLVGVLPKGEWMFRPDACYGYVQGVYLAVFTPVEYTISEGEDRFSFESRGLPNGIVVEALSVDMAASHSISDLQAFGSFMDNKKPVWNGLQEQSADSILQVSYTSTNQDELQLALKGSQPPLQLHNGENIDRV